MWSKKNNVEKNFSFAQKLLSLSQNLTFKKKIVKRKAFILSKIKLKIKLICIKIK
jgi:hypothetical protein